MKMSGRDFFFLALKMLRCRVATTRTLNVSREIRPGRTSPVHIRTLPSSLPFSSNPARFINLSLIDWYKKNAKTPSQLKLKADLEKSYFWEGDQLMKYPDGKVWKANTVLDSVEQSEQWPSMTARDITGTAHSLPLQLNPVSLLLVSGHRFATHLMIETWAGPFIRKFPNLTSNIYEIVTVDHKLYELTGFVWQRLSRQQSPDRASRIIYLYGANAKQIREQFHIDNRLIPYVFLLDSQQRVRWRAVGQANKQELDLLFNFVQKISPEQS